MVKYPCDLVKKNKKTSIKIFSYHFSDVQCPINEEIEWKISERQ